MNKSIVQKVVADKKKFHLRASPNCSNCKFVDIQGWDGIIIGCSKIQSIQEYNVNTNNGLVGENMVCDLYEPVNDDLCGFQQLGGRK